MSCQMASAALIEIARYSNDATTCLLGGKRKVNPAHVGCAFKPQENFFSCKTSQGKKSTLKL